MNEESVYPINQKATDFIRIYWRQRRDAKNIPIRRRGLVKNHLKHPQFIGVRKW